MFKDVEIALVGKYTKLEDAYASVIKALNHASLALNHRLRQSFKTELRIKHSGVRLSFYTYYISLIEIGLL